MANDTVERQGSELVPLAGGGLTRSESLGVVGNALAAQAVAQVSLAMQFALAHPRNEDHARGKMEVFTQRAQFAEKGTYCFPRGNTTVVGAGIVLAKELAKVWGNIQSGSFVIEDKDDERTLRCWAWDLEINYRKEQDVNFKKLIYRRPDKNGKGGGWTVPDERDLLELTNRQGSKGERNCILSVLPYDLVQDAVKNCRDTVKETIKKDPEAFKKNLVKSFASMGVSGEELTAYVGHPLAQITEHQKELLAELKGIYVALRDGDAIWADVVAEKWGKMGRTGEAPSTAKDLREKVRAEAAGLADDKPAAEKPPPENADPPPQGKRAKG